MNSSANGKDYSKFWSTIICLISLVVNLFGSGIFSSYRIMHAILDGQCLIKSTNAAQRVQSVYVCDVYWWINPSKIISSSWFPTNIIFYAIEILHYTKRDFTFISCTLFFSYACMHSVKPLVECRLLLSLHPMYLLQFTFSSYSNIAQSCIQIVHFAATRCQYTRMYLCYHLNLKLAVIVYQLYYFLY